MTAYHVGLSFRGDKAEVEAWVFDLPGCCAIGRSDDEVRSLLPLVIAEHAAWLTGHGIAIENPDPAAFSIVETIVLEVAEERCFADDKAPLNVNELTVAINRLGFSRQELLGITRQLPDILLDWRPPTSSVSVDAWEPEARTIREILNHVASTEGYYRRSLYASEPRKMEAEPQSLFLQRERVLARLRELGAQPENALFHSVWRSEPEAWTVRKALRRLIWHERFHTREIEQRLAWLSLGVPKVS